LGKCELDRGPKNAAFRCPFCAKEGTHKKKFVIRIADDTCHCWVCDFKSRSLVPLLKKIAPEKLAEYVEKFYTGNKKVVEEVVANQILLPTNFQLLPLAIKDPDTRAVWRFLEKRGLSEKDIWKNRLGISSEKRWYRRVIFPSFDVEGNLNFFSARTIDADVFPKYDTPPADKLPIIFNELFVDWTKELVLCEGPFDAIKCGDNVVPLLGSSLSEESYLFEKIVINRTPVALALDADMFDTKTPIIAKKLQEYTIPVRVVRVQTDPGDMTHEDFALALKNAEEPNWKNVMTNKLKKATSVSLSL
jgi:hypothetical protein